MCAYCARAIAEARLASVHPINQAFYGRAATLAFFRFQVFGVTLTWREGHELFQSLALSLLHAVRVSFGHPNIGMS